MSKISYCSLEEAWGPNIDKNQDKQEKIKEKVQEQKNIKEKDYEENNSFRSQSQTDYENLKKDNESMKNILNTMNYIERNKTPENNINEEYNKYRFNPINKVNGLYNDDKDYKPFNDDVEQKSLQDRFVQLENEFRKYKMFMNTRNNNSESEESIESFSNFNNNDSKTDIQDLIVLIVLGLIIIFIMDNIFKLGKYLGSRST
jgi:hypothetical protein|tara:strand:+ start:5282 stop:5887 length:606 start_codon:yes stop_codon:yes gene_type:complete